MLMKFNVLQILCFLINFKWNYSVRPYQSQGLDIQRFQPFADNFTKIYSKPFVAQDSEVEVGEDRMTFLKKDPFSAVHVVKSKPGKKRKDKKKKKRKHDDHVQQLTENLKPFDIIVQIKMNEKE